MANLISLEPVALDLPAEVPEAARTGTTALVVRTGHPLTALLTDLEQRFFPEAPTLFDLPDASDLFTFLVIAVDGYVRHVVRVSAPVLVGRPDLLPFFVTDLIDADPDLTLDDVRSYYDEQDIKIERVLGVETQFRLGAQLEPVRSADLAYLSLFKLVDDFACAGVVAHLNGAAMTSFKRIGLDWQPFAGRADLRTPTIKDDGTVGFDDEYHPVYMPLGTNVELLRGLSAFTPPMFWL